MDCFSCTRLRARCSRRLKPGKKAMPAAKPGEVWMVDLGMAAKVRPCLVLTHPPRPNELDVYTVIAHTTAIRGNDWEIQIQKRFLDRDGAFDVERVATVGSVKLERRLGELTPLEMNTVLNRLAERLGF
jgi:mRNA interferase MazF